MTKEAEGANNERGQSREPKSDVSPAPNRPESLGSADFDLLTEALLYLDKVRIETPDIPDLDCLRYLDPKKFGWDNVAEWLVDYAGLVAGRPSHMGKVSFRYNIKEETTKATVEGRREPTNDFERLVEEIYRSRVTALIRWWRNYSKL